MQTSGQNPFMYGLNSAQLFPGQQIFYSTEQIPSGFGLNNIAQGIPMGYPLSSGFFMSGNHNTIPNGF